MKFSEAVTQHQEVRVLLSRYIIREAATSMGLFTVGRDMSCPLGEWLYKHRTNATPEFQRLVLVHQSFHSIAYDVLKLAMNRREDEAMGLLNGPYAAIEKELIEAILTLSEHKEFE